MTATAPASKLSGPAAGETVASATAPGVPAVIRGSTQLYPVLGSPIAPVKAPMLYNALFASTCARIEELRLMAHKLSDSAEGIVNVYPELGT